MIFLIQFQKQQPYNIIVIWTLSVRRVKTNSKSPWVLCNELYFAIKLCKALMFELSCQHIEFCFNSLTNKNWTPVDNVWCLTSNIRFNIGQLIWLNLTLDISDTLSIVRRYEPDVMASGVFVIWHLFFTSVLSSQFHWKRQLTCAVLNVDQILKQFCKRPLINYDSIN